MTISICTRKLWEASKSQLKDIFPLHDKKTSNQRGLPKLLDISQPLLVCIPKTWRHSKTVKKLHTGVRQAWVLNILSTTYLQWDHGYIYLTSLSLNFLFSLTAPTSADYSFIQQTLTDHLLCVKNLLDTGDSVLNKGITKSCPSRAYVLVDCCWDQMRYCIESDLHNAEHGGNGINVFG